MKQQILTFTTPGRGTTLITTEVAELVAKSKLHTGLCHLFLQHTSASLIICENADLQVRKDLEHFLQRLIPDSDPLFKHVEEGEDDMPAHVRTILTQTSLTIPIHAGALGLGTWQGIYLYEHRYEGHKRRLIISMWGS